MPSILKLRVISARDLPIMDRSSELADAFVEVKFGEETRKTAIARKTLAPTWNEDFRFEVTNDSTLQDDPLEIKVWDHDIVSANDVIGCVVVDVNTVLLDDNQQISGWFPIFDTLRGIRGELQLDLRIEMFENVNKFKDSSPGIMFFTSTRVPVCFSMQACFGFVEELIVEDDPEYHWTDTFRASRQSNEERQLLMYNLSGKLRRLLGVKVQELNGNAVLGYYQSFDFEGETGIVARGYGTACFLSKVSMSSTTASSPDSSVPASPSGRKQRSLPTSPSTDGPPLLIAARIREAAERRELPVPGGLAATSGDVVLLTLRSFDVQQLGNCGGIVMARSIKLVTSKTTPEVRDSWWRELRDEVKSHAHYLGCDCVVGYHETNSIQAKEGLCVLTASGTAAILNTSLFPLVSTPSVNVSVSSFTLEDTEAPPPAKEKKKRKKAYPTCSYCHMPPGAVAVAQAADFVLVRCNMCKRKRVPEILLTTIEPPPGTSITGKGTLLQARVCREKKDLQGEANAVALSKDIPFVEYDIHRQLIAKLRVLGMNALFGVRFSLALNDKVIMAVATGTAALLPALPSPSSLRIKAAKNLKMDMEEIQKVIVERSLKNQENLREAPTTQQAPTPSWAPDESKDERAHELSEDERSEMGEEGRGPSNALAVSDNPNDPAVSEAETTGKASTDFVVQVDDAYDSDMMALLMEPTMPDGFVLCNTETLPGMPPPERNMQMVEVVRKVELQLDTRHINQQFSQIFNNLYHAIWFKLSGQPKPMCVSVMSIDLKLPEDDQVLITLTAMVTRMAEAPSLASSNQYSMRRARRRRVGSPASSSSSDSSGSSSSDSDSSDSSSDSDSPRPDASPIGRSRSRSPPASPRQRGASMASSPTKLFTKSHSEHQLDRPLADRAAAAAAAAGKLPPRHSLDLRHAERQLSLELRGRLSLDDRLVRHPDTDLQFNLDLHAGDSLQSPKRSPLHSSASMDPLFSGAFPQPVALSPLSFVPGTPRLVTYVGRVEVHLIRESVTRTRVGGLGRFTHGFINELHAIARAFVRSLGGNTLLSYRIDECTILQSQSKNQSYDLISISGDAYNWHNEEGSPY